MAVNNTYSTAVTNAPSRKIFRPMFRARWQNMQNIVNDSAFIDMIPEPYVSYYIAYIQQWLQWSRGFVPMLHRSDFFSTGMGYTVCETIARECMRGGYRFESKNEALKDFMDEWAKNDDFTGDLYEMFFNSSAGGNCIMVATPIKGDVYVTAYPINRCFFQIGRRNDVTQATILNRFSAGEDVYYAKETRIFNNGKAYYRVMLGKGTLVVSPTWSATGIKDVPDKIKAQWEYTYGDIQPSKWYELPLESLGVYNIKNKSNASAIADMPGYSDSSLHTALDILYSIDYNYTQAQVDMYMGKSYALIPKQMGGASIYTRGGGVADGMSYKDAITVGSRALDEQFFTEVTPNGIDGKPIQPTLLQPDLRGEAHKYIRDSDLELLASKVGLSSSTLANHLSYNSDKTATQIDSENGTTESTVRTKRDLATASINLMLNDIAKFYGFTEKVEISWGTPSVNSSQRNQDLLNEYQAGTITLEKYLKKRWTELSEEEAHEWAEEIKKEQNEKNSADLSEFYGGLNDDSEQTAELPSVGFGRSGSENTGNGAKRVPKTNPETANK